MTAVPINLGEYLEAVEEQPSPKTRNFSIQQHRSTWSR